MPSLSAFSIRRRVPGARAGAPGSAMAAATVMGPALLALAAALAMTPSDAPLAADDPDPDFSLKDTVQVGPFHMAPFFVLKDLGYDDNTRLGSDQPISDYTVTFGPGARAVAPLGRLAALSVWDEIDYAVFARESDLNHVNNSLRTKLHLYLRDITLYADGEQISNRDRPNAEIDYRIRNTFTAGKFGVIWAPGDRGRTNLFLRRVDYHYSPGKPDLPAGADPNQQDQAVHVGESISDTLERVENTAGLTSSLRILPRTSVLLDLTAGSIDFASVVPQRDSSVASVLGGLEFDPAGSLRGYLKVGYKHLDPTDDAVDGFSGLIADASLSARLLGRGELRAGYQRDTGFSINGENLFFIDDRKALSYEHYMSSRLSVELGRQLEDVDYPIEIQVRGPSDPACDPGNPPVANSCSPRHRKDAILTDWIAIRYRMGPSLRVGLRLGDWRRDSTFDTEDTSRTTIATMLEYTP